MLTYKQDKKINFAFSVFEESQFTPCQAPELTHIIAFAKEGDDEYWNRRMRPPGRTADDDIACGRIMTFDSADAMIESLRVFDK